MHDDTQVSRVIVMGKALRFGQFPVRWVSDLGYGYGYPIFNFYGPLPYYIGGALYAVGIDALVSTKIMFIVGILFAGVAMYAVAQRFVGRIGGILAAILYVYAPYHAVQIYVRGAVGEFWAFAFLPVIFLGFLYAVENKKYASIIGGAGLAGVILSHTILGYVTTLLFIILLFIYWLFHIIRRSFHKNIFISHILLLVFGLGLSAFFWLPALGEMRFTNVAEQIGSTADFRNHFVCLSQLWDSPWGYGGSIQGCIDGLSFKLGKLHLFLAALSVIIWLREKKRFPQFNVAVVVGIILFFISVFLMTMFSERVWNVLPFFSYIQYPWRFLTFALFCLSLIAGGVVIIGPKICRWFLFVISISLIIFLNGKLFIPQYTYAQSSQVFEDREDLRFRVSKISDEYLPPQIERPRTINDIVRDTIPQIPNVSVDTEINTDVYGKFMVSSYGDHRILIRRAYFPGWKYLVNGKYVTPVIESGLPNIHVPAGENVVEIEFHNTPIRTFANMVSIITVLLLLFIYGKKTIT